MNIYVVTKNITEKIINTYMKMPFIKFLYDCYTLSIVHIRAFLTHYKRNASTIVIIPFSTDMVTLLNQINFIKNEKVIIIVYLYGEYNQILQYISSHPEVIPCIEDVEFIVVSQYQFSFKFAKYFKKKIVAFLDHQNYYTKEKKFLKNLYTITQNQQFNELAATLSEHTIYNYFDNMIHIYGKKKVDYDIDEFVVVCLVKNGEKYIRDYIKYYTALGARHIYFIDNGSNDNTITICKEYSQVTVYLTTLSFWSFENQIRAAFIKQICSHRWCLYTDIDEFFDYPYSDKITMKKFLQYLTSNSYTCVLMQMLVLYDIKRIKKQTQNYQFLEKCRYFNLNNIIKQGYNSYKEIFNIKIYNECLKLHFKQRDSDNLILLFKHSLFFVNNTIHLFPNPHFSKNAKIADITCLLKHYKTDITYYEKDFPLDSEKYNDIYQLINKEFIVISDKFREYVQSITVE